MAVRFVIIEKDWYKRRSPNTSLATPIHVEIPDYQALANHMCQMKVTYSDHSHKTLISRVLQNQITKEWTVDGMEVAVKVVED